MGVGSIVTGVVCGFGVQMYANALQKVPLSRYPWRYAFFMLTGAYCGKKYPEVDEAIVSYINERRALQGLKPVVGTYGWDILFASKER